MKKKSILFIIISLLVIGCSKKERTIEYLLDRYIEAYTKASIDAINDMFPPFYIEYSKDYMTKEKLEEEIKEAKEIYGEDFTITYKVGDKTKLNDDELKKLNEKMADIYNAKEEAQECYKYETSLMFKGILQL